MFKDHFSHNSKNYAKYRPGYPSGLFDFIVSKCVKRNNVWDVGCGNGQASVELAHHFDSVLATDASSQQINSATPHERINFQTAPAENCPAGNSTFDLITVAQAIHWFDFEQFWNETRRVANPGALLAFWTYDLHRIDPAVDEIVDQFYEDEVGQYWPPERDIVDAQYRTIQVPFEEIECPVFKFQLQWTRTDMVNYISTWSAVKNYRNDRKEDPIPKFGKSLEKVWPDDSQEKTVTWHNYLRMFKVK